jgi:hypothetical protein
MSEDFKKWLCEKSKVPYMASDKLIKEFQREELMIMIHAMWAINKSTDKHVIIMNEYTIDYYFKDGGHENIKEFLYKNNSEQKALEAALKYVYEQEKK